MLQTHACMCITYTQVIILTTSLSSMIFFLPEKNEENVTYQQVHTPSSLWHPFSKEAVGSTNAGVLQKSLSSSVLQTGSALWNNHELTEFATAYLYNYNYIMYHC